MTKSELYDLILGKEVIMTGGCPGMGFSFSGIVDNIVGDMVMIGENIINITAQNVEISQEENNFHVKLDNGNMVFVTILDNIK